MQPKISVIIPVYKAEQYLHRCVDSILSQTFTDFEIILVNDGSPDNSGAICDEYAQKDSRVRVFHKENGGVTAARADGVKNSHGEWITFVDADDYLFSDSLKILYNNINSDIDIIIGSIENKYNKLCHEDTIISHDEYQKSLIIYNNGNWSLCGKFYRKELFIDKIFDIHHQCIYGEDAIANIRISFICKKNIKYINDTIYYYYIHEDSCVGSFKNSFKYFSNWYNLFYESIPKDRREEYNIDLIKLRLLNIPELHKHYIKENIWQKLDYHVELENDIKKTNYKLTSLGNIAINSHNPITSCLYIIINFCLAKIKKLINTHLS